MKSDSEGKQEHGVLIVYVVYIYVLLHHCGRRETPIPLKAEFYTIEALRTAKRPARDHPGTVDPGLPVQAFEGKLRLNDSDRTPGQVYSLKQAYKYPDLCV